MVKADGNSLIFLQKSQTIPPTFILYFLTFLADLVLQKNAKTTSKAVIQLHRGSKITGHHKKPYSQLTSLWSKFFVLVCDRVIGWDSIDA